MALRVVEVSELPCQPMDETLLPHPLAELFPLMTGADFEALVDDIRANGQHHAVVTLDGKILDGRNRYRACMQIGIEPRLEQFGGPGTPYAFVASVNLHRRHLNETQRAMIATRMARLYDGLRSDRVEPSQGAAITAPTLTQTEAANILKVSRGTVQSARVVLERGTPEEIAAADEGKLGLRTTADAIRDNISPAEREKNRLIPSHKKGGMPKAHDNQRMKADIWGQLRDALKNLSSLPAAADVVKIARGMDRTGLVDRTLPIATAWLAEFEDAYTK
jgi:hypothetical protein